MTGFKLHYPPGFVDRAYLVFLWLLSLHIQLPVDGGSGRSHPPFAFESLPPASRPGYEPRGRQRPVRTPGYSRDSRRGPARAVQAAMGLCVRRADRLELQAPSPRRDLPLTARAGTNGPRPLSQE